jgi:hypothetical protein
MAKNPKYRSAFGEEFQCENKDRTSNIELR